MASSVMDEQFFNLAASGVSSALSGDEMVRVLVFRGAQRLLLECFTHALPHPIRSS